MGSLYGISAAIIDEIVNKEIEEEKNLPFILYSRTGKGLNRHRFTLQFSTYKHGKYLHLNIPMLEETLMHNGNTIRRIIVEEDQSNCKLGVPDYRVTDLITKYCKELREMHLMNFVEVGDDFNCNMSKLRRMAITNCTLSLPLGGYFTKCENTLVQLEITQTAVELSNVKLSKLKHLKLSNSIVMDLAMLLENCSSLEVLEILKCHLIGKSIENAEHLQNIHMLNLQTNDNYTLSHLNNFRGLKTLRLQTDLVADSIIQGYLATKHSLESITFDAFVTVRTVRVIVREKSLRHLRIEGRCLADFFSDYHFAALENNTLHELELLDYCPLMENLKHVVQTSLKLKVLKLSNYYRFEEYGLMTLRNAGINVTNP